jgi:hypothetical protein
MFVCERSANFSHACTEVAGFEASGDNVYEMAQKCSVCFREYVSASGVMP